MTTIAYKDGVLAYDTRVVLGYRIQPSTVEKAFLSHKHQCIFFGCGVWGEVSAAIRDLESVKKGELPWNKNVNVNVNFSEDTMIGCVDKDGKLYLLEDSGWSTSKQEYFSIGSGSSFALSAMHHGQNSEESIHTAAKFDIFTGTPVRTLKLSDLKKEPKTKKR